MEASPVQDGQAEQQAQNVAPPGGPQNEVTSMAWRALLHPSVLLATALLVLLLAVAAANLPQLPDQLRDEPAASARWFITTTAEYGVVGPLLRGVGLFDVFRGLLFRLILAFFTLLLSIHFAQSVGALLLYIRVKQNLCAMREEEAEPISYGQPLYRARFSSPEAPSRVAKRLAASMGERFAQVVSCPDPSGTDVNSWPAQTDETSAGEVQSEGSQAVEVGHRKLGTRDALSYFVRPLLPLGLLLALTVVWLFLLAGWELRSPTLAPGETYRAPSRNLHVAYNVPDTEPIGQDSAYLTIQIGQQMITATAVPDFRALLGSSRMSGRSAAPGLLISVAGDEPLLAQPGQSERTESVGLILPSPGSEESVLIPDRSAGLRIVRRADVSLGYIVELYRGTDLQPQQRIEVNGPLRATVGTGSDAIELSFVPLPGMEMTVQHMPGQWVLWVAVALCTAGMLGLVRPPAFAVMAVGPWPVSRSQVILYASKRTDLEELADSVADVESGNRPDRNAVVDRILEAETDRGASTT